ncbi:MAG TPA: 6-carboxyhexanoate--CoA ligase, partial [Nitrospirota bacterium]|nr:6-carboxyhexanoate--CoA ligase [Nitrospirota bacterium]
MTAEALYSIRMRASNGDHHVSGAERISHAENIDNIVMSLIARAKSKGGIPRHITINVESLQNSPVQFLTALDILTVTVPDMHAGRVAAAQTLRSLGASKRAVIRAIELLSRGASPAGTTMRGSIIMDSRSGVRLEPDQERGVRASRFDYSDDAYTMVAERLTALGLTHHRTREAIALATKVAYAQGVIAE